MTARSLPAASITARMSSIGEPGAPFVEADQPGKTAQRFQEAGAGRPLPVQIEVRAGSGSEHEIDLPVARDLIGDVHIAALCIARLG